MKKVVSLKPPLHYAFLFSGCGASKEDCQYYGYEYYSSDYNTDCCQETVHLCVYPKQPPLPQPTPVNKFQVCESTMDCAKIRKNQQESLSFLKKAHILVVSTAVV